jgi:hypothetical protein
MATSIHFGPASVPSGSQAFEIDTPVRANGAHITVRRFGFSWPAGALFNWRVYERERNGTLNLLTQGEEQGGPVVGRDGTIDPPLLIGLSWQPDKDKDLLRFEVDVFQTFTTEVFIDWV